MNQQDLSNTAWAYAHCELQHGPLIHATAAAALKLLSALDSRSLSLIAWSVAKRLLGNQPLLASIAAASLRLLSEAGPQGLSNTAWAFATRAVAHPPLFQAISASSLPPITQFGQQEISNTAWAFAELRVADVPLCQSISAAALPKLGDFSVPDDSEEADRSSYALAWAQGRLSCLDLARELIGVHASCGRCHRLSLGLLILDEEWSRDTPPGGALAALEAITGRSMGPRRQSFTER